MMERRRSSRYESSAAGSHGDKRSGQRRIDGGFVGKKVPEAKSNQGFFSGLFGSREIRPKGLRVWVTSAAAVGGLLWGVGYALTEMTKYRPPAYNSSNPADAKDNASILLGLGLVCKEGDQSRIIGARPLGSLLERGFGDGINERWEEERVTSINLLIDQLTTNEGIDSIQNNVLSQSGLTSCERGVLTDGFDKYREKIKGKTIKIETFRDRADLFDMYMDTNIEALEGYRDSLKGQLVPGEYTPESIGIIINNIETFKLVYRQYANEQMGFFPTVTPTLAPEYTAVPDITPTPPIVRDFTQEPSGYIPQQSIREQRVANAMRAERKNTSYQMKAVQPTRRRI